MDDEKTRKLIKLNEGYKKHAYDDATGMNARAPIGYLTIGVGRNIDLAGGGPGLRDSEIEFLLTNDIEEHFNYCLDLIPDFLMLSDVRQAVFIDMCHNMGIDDLADFRNMLAAVALQDWANVVKEMVDSKWWNQVGVRAQRLADMVLTDEWPKAIA